MALAKVPKSSLTTIVVYLNYFILILFGHIRDFFLLNFPNLISEGNFPPTPKGYAPIFKSFENFFSRRIYTRIRDCFNRPISSAPSNYFDVLKVVSKDYNRTQVVTKESKRCLNLGSYNYLGFAESPKHVTKEVVDCLYKYGVSSCSTRADYGTTPLHKKLERRIAKFVGKEDAIVVGMGYATNTTSIPALVSGKGCLIISDSENHASIITGAKSCSGVKVRVFKHNNVEVLEKLIRNAIAYGQPRTGRAWRKIVIVVEGIYSMEGEICKLKEIVEVKQKYGCYLYVDEAHSIGALGSNGKGVCDFWGVDPSDIDVLMGTFTKSFGSVGGYIAADKKIIKAVRRKSWAQLYTIPLSPVCAQQILSAIDVITGEDGTNIGKRKLKQLNENSKFFKGELVKRKFEVLGDANSPVVCVMLYHVSKLPAFSRECLNRGLGVVVVGSPATDIVGSRVRFCLSSSHTRKDLEKAIKIIDDVGELIQIKYCQ